MSQIEHESDEPKIAEAAAAPVHGPDVREETPEAFTGLRVTPMKTSAAGIPAVISSMRHVWGEMVSSAAQRDCSL